MNKPQRKPVVIMRGAPGCGKTTTSKLLRDKLGGFYIDGDHIIRVTDTIEDKEAQLQIFLMLIQSEAKKASFKQPIILDWITPQEELIGIFQSIMSQLGRKTIPVTLHTTPSTCAVRNCARGTPRNIDEIVRDLLLYSDKDPGLHLNNTNMTPEQSVEKVMEMLAPELG